MTYNYKNIPEELKELKRWVLWKKIEKDGRTTKVPISVYTGYGAKSNDPATWAPFEFALARCELYNCEGLGFMLGNGYFGVDIDHAIDNKELIDEFVNALHSYTEISQSGEGIHIICKGVLPVGARRKGNIEMYDNARFFALTANLYNPEQFNGISDKTAEIAKLWAKYVKSEENEQINIQPNETRTLLEDEQVITKAKESQSGNLFTCLYYGQWEGLYPSQSEADMAFAMMLAFWCGKDKEQMDRIFRDSKLYREKWDQKRGTATYGDITLTNACLKCKDVYSPSFNAESQNFNIQTGEVITKKNYDLNDTGNAQRFIDRFGANIRYNFDNKTWMIYDGKTWIKDVKQLVKTQVDILIDEMKIEAIRENDKETAKEMMRNVKHLSNNSGKEAMLKEAMHIGIIPTTNADYDKQNYLLNCFNGIVDLKTGAIIPHDRHYMLSKNTCLNVDMENEPVRWKQFLAEVFNNDADMCEYVQRAVGYTLTGDTKEQCFFQCYGDGANGKSVFLDIIYAMLGDYALNSQVESILAKSNISNGASSEIARMNGARFVRTNEPNESSRFNEGLVKQLVSGDVTTARFLYGSEFEFTPRFKLWIATNYKIQVRGTDYGIWRRMRLVPFEMKFEGDKADKDLTDKLMRELPQILGWAVKGTLKWQDSGLKTPQAILDANKQYKQEMDIVASFLNDCAKQNLNGREKASDVFKEYSQWAKEGHEYCMTQSKFGVEMAKRFQKKNVNGYIYYLGITLKKHDESYVYEKDKV